MKGLHGGVGFPGGSEPRRALGGPSAIPLKESRPLVDDGGASIVERSGSLSIADAYVTERIIGSGMPLALLPVHIRKVPPY